MTTDPAGWEDASPESVLCQKKFLKHQGLDWLESSGTAALPCPALVSVSLGLTMTRAPASQLDSRGPPRACARGPFATRAGAQAELVASLLCACQARLPWAQVGLALHAE